MRLFRRKDRPELRPCPRCSQLVEAGALECPMCGLDLRETYEPPAAAHQRAADGQSRPTA